MNVEITSILSRISSIQWLLRQWVPQVVVKLLLHQDFNVISTLSLSLYSMRIPWIIFSGLFLNGTLELETLILMSKLWNQSLFKVLWKFIRKSKKIWNLLQWRVTIHLTWEISVKLFVEYVWLQEIKFQTLMSASDYGPMKYLEYLVIDLLITRIDSGCFKL